MSTERSSILELVQRPHRPDLKVKVAMVEEEALVEFLRMVVLCQKELIVVQAV